MGAKQYGDQVAARLNGLERQLAFTAERLKEQQEVQDFLWQQVFDLFDHELGDGAPARFVCEDGFVLARVVPRLRPVMNTPKLIEKITRHVKGLKAKLMLGRVLAWEPRVDQDKLAKEVRLGRLTAKLVEACLTPQQATPRRYRREASKHERQALEAGILESPTEDLWEEAG